jgi:glucan 1,3-beta-glucosidase
MPLSKAAMPLLALYLLFLFSTIVYAAPKPQAAAPTAAAGSSTYWLANIPHNGKVAYGSDPSYPVYRNVKSYGAIGE